MLSFVLPLLAIAIALTPVVVSARAVYKCEVDEHSSLEAIKGINVEIHN